MPSLGALSFGSPFYPGHATVVAIWKLRVYEAEAQLGYWTRQYAQYGDDTVRAAMMRAHETLSVMLDGYTAARAECV